MNVAGTSRSDLSLTGIRRRQILSLVMLFMSVVIVTALTWQSVTNMVSIWNSDSAYNHGYFIVPIACYMAWERRHRLAGLVVAPYWPGLFLVIGFSAVWLAARGASIMEGEQIAYVGMVQGLILTVLGRKVFRAQLLPILYLWLMVPTGGFLIPGLQTIATWLTMQLLQLTSIPFFVEQFYFQLPVGLFFVAPGCSGLNFLLAALALSIIYAELMYVGWQRKLICIMVWLGVAILANGVRIFGILVLAEITDRQLAIVDDHILYGWGFFFIILIGLMYVGRRFSNMPPLSEAGAEQAWLPAGAASVGQFAVAAAVPAMLATLMIGYGLVVFSDGVKQAGLTITPPQIGAGWNMRTELGYSEHTFPNADARRVWKFENDGTEVNLFVAYYDAQWDGHEAVADNHNILGMQEMKITSRATPSPVLNAQSRRVTEETVAASRNDILIWRWYCAAGTFTSSPLEVRLRTSLGRALRQDNSAVVFTLFAIEREDMRDKMTSVMEAIRVAAPGLTALDAKGQTIGGLVCW